MEFNPNNPVVKLCLQGMAMEEKDELKQARDLFLEAWNEASGDLEKFHAAHYLSRHQESVSDKLQWLKTALEHALEISDDSVMSALPALYCNIASCHEQLDNSALAKENRDLAASFSTKPSHEGPFYHGTRADLQIGDKLNAGGNSNYEADLQMNHIFFTALKTGAGLAAAMAKGDERERVYIVEPTGPFENDPNVTDKKFPGNPTRSYRSDSPLEIVGEVTDWERQTPEQLQQWREKLAKNQGQIIN